MKQLSVKKFVSAIFSGLLVLLGFPGCSSDEPIRYMYGPPESNFEIKGKVVEKENNEKLITGIRVITYPVFEGKQYKEYADTLFTNFEGIFKIPANGHQYIDVLLKDIDGEENGGTFKEDSIRVDLTNMQQKDIIYLPKENKYQYQLNIELERDTALEE